MHLAKLNRSMSHRKALFRNLVSALIEHEQIRTTLPKAKAISRLAERVITWSKYGTADLFYQRKAESYLTNWVRVRRHLFHTLSKRYADRAGGYTRIHRLGHRANDHAPLAVIELVDNPRDLKRDKMIRTAARELVEIEVKHRTRSHGGSQEDERSKVPVAVWRNVPCQSEEEAERAIADLVKLLPELTRKNLKKVLSEPYIRAYQYCQPVQIPTKEEAQLEMAQRKQLKHDPDRVALNSSDRPFPKSSPLWLSTQAPASTRVTKAAYNLGIPRPLGAYTDFLYHVRLHFHRNLALRNPKKLGTHITPNSLHPGQLIGNKRLESIPSFELNDDQDDPGEAEESKPEVRKRWLSARRLREAVKRWVPSKGENVMASTRQL